MGLCSEEFRGFRDPREIYSLDKTVHHYTIILGLCKWRSSWIFSKFWRPETGMLHFLYLFVLCMNVLSHKLDKAVREKKFKFHQRCKALLLTHLCFADDLMVFVEGLKESIEGALTIFDEFSVWSGLSISLEKSTVYMVGVSDIEKKKIKSNIPFAKGKLQV